MFTNSKQLEKGKKYYFEAENAIVTYVTDNKAYSNRVGVASQSGNTFEVFVDSLMEIEDARIHLAQEIMWFTSYDEDEDENDPEDSEYIMALYEMYLNKGNVDSIIEELKGMSIDEDSTYGANSLIEKINILKVGEA